MTVYTPEQIVDILLHTKDRLTADINIPKKIIERIDSGEIAQDHAELLAIGITETTASKLVKYADDLHTHTDQITQNETEAVTYQRQTLLDLINGDMEQAPSMLTTSVDLEDLVKPRPGYLAGRPCQYPPAMIAAAIFDRKTNQVRAEDKAKDAAKPARGLASKLFRKISTSKQTADTLGQSIQILKDLGLNEKQIGKVRDILKTTVNDNLGTAIDRIFEKEARTHTDLELSTRIAKQASDRFIDRIFEKEAHAHTDLELSARITKHASDSLQGQHLDAKDLAAQVESTIHDALVKYASNGHGVLIQDAERGDQYYLGQRLHGGDLDPETVAEIKKQFIGRLSTEMGTNPSETPHMKFEAPEESRA